MNKCAICGREFDAAEPLVLFSAPKTHTDYYACSSCERQINRVLESKDPDEYRKALNYIYTFAAETQNHDIKAYLTEFLENNADHEILKKLVVMNGPDLVMGKLKTKDYYQTTTAYPTDTDGWIAGMKILLWIAFIAIVGIGISIAAPFFRYQIGLGILIVVLSLVVAFMTVAGSMVFLNMAQDIRAIRNKQDSEK
jgi:DNA-directed RNA polymerase subunit RPC12/RpoP